MYSSSAPDVSLFQNMLGKFSEKGGLGKFAKNLKRGIGEGFDTRESAIATLRNYASVRGWDPGKVERKVRKIQGIQPTSIASERYSPFAETVKSTYQDLLGRAPTEQEIQQRFAQAGAERISPSDPGAFGAFLSDRLASSPEGMGKIKTEADLQFEAMFGPMGRTPEGYLKRGVIKFRPEVVGGVINKLQNTAYPGLFDRILKSYDTANAAAAAGTDVSLSL